MAKRRPLWSIWEQLPATSDSWYFLEWLMDRRLRTGYDKGSRTWSTFSILVRSASELLMAEADSRRADLLRRQLRLRHDFPFYKTEGRLDSLEKRVRRLLKPLITLEPAVSGRPTHPFLLIVSGLRGPDVGELSVKLMAECGPTVTAAVRYPFPPPRPPPHSGPGGDS